jgi:hypothetical protein
VHVVRRLAAVVLVLLTSLCVDVGPGASLAWACAAPPWKFESVTFDGKVVAIKGDLVTFSLDPPVAGLGKTEDVVIYASNTSSDCAVTDAPPVVGKRFHVWAGRPPAGNGTGLSVTNLYGGFSPVESLTSSSAKWPYLVAPLLVAAGVAMVAKRWRAGRETKRV